MLPYKSIFTFQGLVKLVPPFFLQHMTTYQKLRLTIIILSENVKGREFSEKKIIIIQQRYAISKICTKSKYCH